MWTRRAWTLTAVGVLLYGHFRVLASLKASFGASDDFDEFEESEKLARAFPRMEGANEGQEEHDAGEEVDVRVGEGGGGGDGGVLTTVASNDGDAVDPLRATLTPPRPSLKRPTCDDDNDACTGWASNGECAKNPGYMLETCKLSCRVCEADDVVEMDSARVGYVTLNTGAKMPMIGYGTAVRPGN